MRLWHCTAGPAEVSFAGTFNSGVSWRCTSQQGEIPTLVELQPSPALRIPARGFAQWDKFSNVSNASVALDRLHDAQQSISLGAALCAEASATVCFARLLEEFAAAHLFFNSAPLDQFTESADRFLDAFAFAYRQFNHACSGSSQAGMEMTAERPTGERSIKILCRHVYPAGEVPGFVGLTAVSGFVGGA